MDKKSNLLRHSLAVGNGGLKTPTRPRFAGPAVPTTVNRADARFSLGGVPNSARRQSLFKTPGAVLAVPKDTNDKGLIQENIRKIHEFLLLIDGDEAPTEAFLRGPTAKDFLRIFESIYECISPGFEFADMKLETDIPRIFSELHYPYTIKASTMKTVGAPHSWHYLLHALAWLVDFVQMFNNVENGVGSQILLGSDNTDGTVRAFRYAWLATTYKEYSVNKNIIQEDDWAQRKQTELQHWFANQDNITNGIDTAIASLEVIKRECEELMADNGREAKIKEDIHRVTDDLRKADNYHHMVKQAQDSAQAEMTNRVAETKEVRGAVEQLRLAVNQKKERIAQQEKGERGFTGKEARQIMTEIEQNRTYLRELQANMEALSKESWHLGPRDTEQFAQLQTKYSDLVGSISHIRLRYLGERENTYMEEGRPKDVMQLQTRLNAEMRDLMLTTRKELEARLRSVDKDIQATQSEIGHLGTRIQMESEKRDDHSRQLHRQTLNLQRLNEEQQKERQVLQNIIDSYENEKELLEDKFHKIGELEQALTTEKLELDDMKRKVSGCIVQQTTELMSVTIPIADSIDTIQCARDSMSRVLKDITQEKYGFKE